MKKLSAYQKLKRDRDYLRKQLFILARDVNSPQSKMILMKLKFLIDIENRLMAGDIIPSQNTHNNNDLDKYKKL